MEANDTTLTTVLPTGPVGLALFSAGQNIQETRNALIAAHEHCTKHWEYQGDNLKYLVNDVLRRALTYIEGVRVEIEHAPNEETLLVALRQLREQFDSIGGRNLASWLANNTKDLRNKQQSLINVLNGQLQDALSQPKPDAEVCLVTMAALQFELQRQAEAVELWSAALQHLEEARGYYATAQRLAILQFGVEMPTQEPVS